MDLDLVRYRFGTARCCLATDSAIFSVGLNMFAYVCIGVIFLVLSIGPVLSFSVPFVHFRSSSVLLGPL